MGRGAIGKLLHADHHLEHHCTTYKSTLFLPYSINFLLCLKARVRGLKLLFSFSFFLFFFWRRGGKQLCYHILFSAFIHARDFGWW
ncbi:hypothetical protein BDV27DRAFT_139973 [Aspergillus caelatus]|uniref:Uncharacterized protein n=1 Tax=Aspergillus caelatus TaxID=61420 RepID=A0A5N6ZHF6_9EURO|nr:uncharacterized protein BDV27DRAFT_139973 [Aspergillus caelatus]KAE8357082.1 hypothetical protein BDV27DRAFT_139973 [Aspergillus caelatus]